jgi:tetratricopeptide (TPR) repeat protein
VNPSLSRRPGCPGCFAYPEAQSALEQAILVDSEEWLPHDLLASTYLHQREYSKARDEAQIAVAKSARAGKNASSASELTLGQALIGLGQKDEGIEALRVFLKESPPENMGEPVRALIKRVRLNQSVVQSGLSEPERCAISVPYASIPCALKRFFSIPDQIASVRAWLSVSD